MLVRLINRMPKSGWFAAGLCILVGFVFVVGWSSAQPHHREAVNCAANCTDNQKTQDVAAQIVATYTKLLAWFTAVLALSTIGLWSVSYLSLRHANKTTKRQLRAYVMIEGAVLEAEPNLPNDWAIHVQVKNFGQTPAYGVAITTEYELADPKPTEAIFPITAAAIKHARTIMGPNKIHVLRLPCDNTRCYLTNGTFGFSRISSAGKKVYVWGRIDYMTFDEHRWLTFQLVCHMGQVTAFSFSEAGNDADDQHRQEYRS